MVTQKQAFDYYKKMYDNGSIYVWGFNSGTVITRQSIDKAYKSFASKTYNRAYYEAKLKEGLGKNGSDCSGAHYGISGYDTTAQGYYRHCRRTGPISSLPKDKLVLIFNGPTVNGINHTGVYMGNGKVFHMKSSKANAVYEALSRSTWKWWGYADFISDYDTFSFWDNQDWTKRLQKILGVTADGVFGAKSLAASVEISKDKNRKHGSVKLLQDKLNYLGFSCGEIDGVFGETTYKAVVAFQKKNGLTADGIVGKNTWKKLVEAE